MATNSTTASTSVKKASKKRKAEDSVDNQSSETVLKKEKDRIKTLDQFQFELNELMKTKQEHQDLKDKLAVKYHEHQTLRARIVPFMLENLKQNRVDCSAYNMYLSTSVVNRQRKVQLEHIYEIIKQELGVENLALIKKKAAELKAQKVPSRQIVIKKIQNTRAEKKKQKEEEARQAALAGRPIEKKRAKKQ